jgi:hypothetical protein
MNRLNFDGFLSRTRPADTAHGHARARAVQMIHHRPPKLRLAMAERCVRSRPSGGARMKDWLVPPVLFPIFLIVLIVGYAILRTPT